MNQNNKEGNRQFQLTVDKDTYEQIMIMAKDAGVSEQQIIGKAVAKLYKKFGQRKKLLADMQDFDNSIPKAQEAAPAEDGKVDKVEKDETAVYFDTIQKILNRPISCSEGAVYSSFLSYYKFPKEVVYLMTKYSHFIGQDNYLYIKTVLRDWSQKGIKTEEAARAEVNKMYKMHQITEQLLQLISQAVPEKYSDKAKNPRYIALPKNAVNMYIKWRNQGMTDEMISNAVKICDKTLNEINFPYINGILKRTKK